MHRSQIDANLASQRFATSGTLCDADHTQILLLEQSLLSWFSALKHRFVELQKNEQEQRAADASYTMVISIDAVRLLMLALLVRFANAKNSCVLPALPVAFTHHVSDLVSSLFNVIATGLLLLV